MVTGDQAGRGDEEVRGDDDKRGVLVPVIKKILFFKKYNIIMF
jgi:hypothetical protein